MHLGQDAQSEKHQFIFSKILATSLIQIIVIADIVPVSACLHGLCSVTECKLHNNYSVSSAGAEHENEWNWRSLIPHSLSWKYNICQQRMRKWQSLTG